MKKLGLSMLAFFAPVVVFAQYGQAQAQAQVFNILDFVKRILNWLIVASIVVALLYFIWSVMQYVRSGGGEEQAEARSKIIMSIIALFVIVGVWGLIALLGGVLGVGQGGSAPVPCVIDADPATPGCQ
jgi:hypothetical protein